MENTKTAFNEYPHMKNVKKYLEKALEELKQEDDFETRFIMSDIKNDIEAIDNNIQTYLERCCQSGECVQF